MKVSIMKKNQRGHHNRWLRAECEECEFRYDNDPPFIGHNHVFDLKVAYNILKGDISTKAYGSIMTTVGLKRVSVDTIFSNHQSHVLGLHRKFYEKMKKIVHEAVIKIHT